MNDQFSPDEQLLHAALGACEVPADVEARLRGRLSDFRDRVAVRSSGRGRRHWLPAAHPLRWAAAAAAVAAALVVFSTWRSPRSEAWAEVVKQVEAMPWIHGQGKSHGRSVEFWISLPQKILAFRAGQLDFVAYMSSHAKTKLQYHASDATLVQLPMEADDEQEFHQADALFSRAFRGEPQADLSTSREKLIEQRISEVEVDGRKWLDVELTFQFGGENAGRRRVLIYRVDPTTRLPKSCVEKPWFVDDPEDRIDFDYPQSGPADIYALGVPRDAKIVDRVPSPELNDILTGMRTARENMDAYSGLIIQAGPGFHWSEAMCVWRVWRSGNRWRIEQSSPDLPGRWKVGEPKPVLPPDDVDRQAWWKAAAEKIQFFPVLVSDGKTSYRFTVKTEPEKVVDWSKVRFVIESVEPDYMPTPIAFVGPSANLLPEQVARPPLGSPSEDSEASIDVHPTNGPKGTILVSVSDNRVGSPQQSVWIDPAKSFMALRQELSFGVNSQGTPQIQLHEIIEAVQSPHGVWYPRVIHGGAAIEQSGEEVDESESSTTTHYYLDFTTPIPPEVFATPELKKKSNPRPAAAEPRTQQQANQRAWSGTHARTIAFAMNAYVEEHGHFPSAVVLGPDGKTPHSWRVALLPYLGKKDLLDRYHLDEPWDSASNLKLLAEMPDVYSAQSTSSGTNSAFFVLTGPQTLFPPSGPIRMRNITDSAGATLAVVEAKRDIPWTKPEDIPYDASQPLPSLGGFDPDGFSAAFADGSPRFIEPKQFDEATIRAWITPAGGEDVKRPD